MAAHPTPAPGRHPQHQRMVGHIAAHYCARANKGVASDRGPADDSSISTDGCPAPHQRAQILVMANDLRAGIDHIRKYTGRTAENIIFQLHTSIDRDIVLDLDITTDQHVAGDQHILAEVAAFTDNSVGQDMAEVPY